jgi:hypothetical protein
MEWGDCKPMVGLVVVVQLSAVWHNWERAWWQVIQISCIFWSCGKVWIIWISLNIWMYNYKYLKFFFKQGWVKKLWGMEKKWKRFSEELQSVLRSFFQIPSKFLRSFFEVSPKNLTSLWQTVPFLARDAVILLPHEKRFVRTWRCSSIAAVCGAALSRPSLVSVVALVLVNPHRQSGIAASRNRYLGRLKNSKFFRET